MTRWKTTTSRTPGRGPSSRTLSIIESVLDEGPLPGVLEVVVFHRVIRHKNVEQPGVAEVGSGDAHGAAFLGHARLFGDVGEGAIAIVAVERARLWAVAQRAGITRGRVKVAELAVVVENVVRDEDV